MPDTDTLLINRQKPRRKSRKTPTRAVKVGIDLKGTHSNSAQAESIRIMVEEQMKLNGYKRNEDPMIQEIKKITDRYRRKMS